MRFRIKPATAGAKVYASGRASMRGAASASQDATARGSVSRSKLERTISMVNPGRIVRTGLLRVTDPRSGRSRCSGFTLAEVLAALALMAIVIPVIIEAMHVANLAGEVAQRKAIAARLGERLLTENIVAQQWSQTVQNGAENVGPYQFNWTIHNDTWNPSTAGPAVNASTINATGVHELSVDVAFTAQNQNYSVHLSTLIDTTRQ